MSEMSLAGRWAARMVNRPWAVAAVLATVIVASLVLIPRLRIESGLEVFLPRSAPQWQDLDKVEDVFVNDEVIFVAYHTDDPFSQARLVQLREVQAQLEAVEIPGKAGGARRLPVDDVTCLTSVKDLIGSDMSFRTVQLVPDPVPSDARVLRAARRQARRNPIVRDWLLAEDPHVAAIVVRLAQGLADTDRAAAVDAVREVLARQQQRVPETEYHVSGGPVADADTARYQTDDLAVFMPISYAVVVLLLYVFVRRTFTVIVAAGGVTIALLGGLAMLAAIGSSINNGSAMVPPVMIAMTVAMMLHYFSEVGKYAPGRSPLEGTRTTLRHLLPPAVIAALTTAIGFASLAVSSVPAVWGFGLAAGGGVIIAAVVAASLFTLIARRRPLDRVVAPRGIARAQLFGGLFVGLDRFVQRRHKLVMGLSIAFIVVVGAGIVRINVDMQAMRFFKPTAPIRQANDFIEEHLGGASMFIMAVRANKSDAFSDPANLQRLEKLEEFLQKEVDMQHVTSLVGFIKLMHRAFSDGRPEYWRIPDTQQQAAQLLLLAGDERMDEYVDEHRKWVRIVARTKALPMKEVLRRSKRIDAYMATLFPEEGGFESYTTGRTRIGAELLSRLVSSQIKSLAVSALLIFGLIFVIFRSLATGLVAIVPNILPIATNVGLMGWVGIDLDAATVMTSTVALGIAVDDTVHLLQQLRTQLASHGNMRRAISETLKIKGPAIVWTSVVLTLGFGVLMLSNFVPTRNFGLLICVAMGTALIGDLLMLPAMILCTGTRLGIRGPSSNAEDAGDPGRVDGAR